MGVAMKKWHERYSCDEVSLCADYGVVIQLRIYDNIEEGMWLYKWRYTN